MLCDAAVATLAERPPGILQGCFEVEASVVPHFTFLQPRVVLRNENVM